MALAACSVKYVDRDNTVVVRFWGRPPVVVVVVVVAGTSGGRPVVSSVSVLTSL